MRMKAITGEQRHVNVSQGWTFDITNIAR